MKKIFKALIILFVVFVSSTFVACTDSAKKDFNHLLIEVAGNDYTIDRDEWHKLQSFIDENKAHFKEFYHDGQLDKESVKKYITDFFSKRRDAHEINFVGLADEPIKVNFFLERSGSMIAYDAPQGDGSFKAAIVQMLNNLPDAQDKHQIYVVNSSITPYPQGIQQFVNDNNIFASTKGIGDASYTDFGAIFDKILNKTKDNELSILVTDMIYSTKNMMGVNAQKVFAEAQSMTHTVFRNEVKNKAMLIVKMIGSYDGLYYPYLSPNKGYPYHGKRPYYIVIVGNNENMARLTTDAAYKVFAQLSELKGYENMYLFDTDDTYKPYYSFLLSHPDIRGRFEPQRGQGTQIKNLEGVEPDKNSGDIKLVLAVDLSKMLIDNDYLTNIHNYKVEADNQVKIQQIRKIDKKDLSAAEKKYVGSATHLFILSVDKVSNEQEVSIKLLNHLPSWVSASSCDDDTSADSYTTFGLKYLLQGIYNSYLRNSDGEPYYFEMKIKMK